MKNQTIIEFVDSYMKNEITIKKVSLTLKELIAQKEKQYDIENPTNNNLTVCVKNNVSSLALADKKYLENDFENDEITVNPIF